MLASILACRASSELTGRWKKQSLLFVGTAPLLSQSVPAETAMKNPLAQPNKQNTIDRRRFLRISSVTASGITLGSLLPSCSTDNESADVSDPKQSSIEGAWSGLLQSRGEQPVDSKGKQGQYYNQFKQMLETLTDSPGSKPATRYCSR
jgi:hypothetical protein